MDMPAIALVRLVAQAFTDAIFLLSRTRLRLSLQGFLSAVNTSRYQPIQVLSFSK